MIRTETRDSYIMAGVQLIMVNLSGRSDARIQYDYFLFYCITQGYSILICNASRVS